MSIRFDETVVRHALRKIGTPYIWAGKGDYAVRDGKVVKMASLGCDEGFDCSGLVTWAVKQAGGPDLRGTWNAQRMWQELPVIDDDNGEDEDWFALALYGKQGHASHVSIEIGRGIVLEASGGDSRTLTLTDSLKQNAFVRIHFDERRDFLGYRSLAAMQRKRP